MALVLGYARPRCQVNHGYRLVETTSRPGKQLPACQDQVTEYRFGPNRIRWHRVDQCRVVGAQQQPLRSKGDSKIWWGIVAIFVLSALFVTGCQPSAESPEEPALETSFPAETTSPLPTRETPTELTAVSSRTPSQEVEPSKTPVMEASEAPVESEQPGLATPEISPIVTADAADVIVDLARQQLAAYLSISPEMIEVVAVESVLWRDSSLDCPLPGFAYTQAAVEGFRIDLSVGDQLFTYHADDRGRVILCQDGQPILPDLPAKPGEIDDGQPWIPID